MAAMERQLVIAVEGTAALAPFWSTILADYVEKIVRYACAPDSPLLFSSLLSSPLAWGSKSREKERRATILDGDKWLLAYLGALFVGD